MSNIEPYIRAASIGWSASEVTGDPKAGFKAGGTSAWIQSVTGSPPALKKLPGGRVRLELSASQQDAMSEWLDSQVHRALFVKGDPPSVEVALGPVFKPWAMKYAIPAFVGAVATGWIAHYLSAR